MNSTYARRVIPRTDDEMWAGLFDDERRAADRAAYAETRDRLADAIAPPTCGGGPYYGGTEGEPASPGETRFILGVIAVCFVIFGALTVAVRLWAMGQIVWR